MVGGWRKHSCADLEGAQVARRERAAPARGRAGSEGKGAKEAHPIVVASAQKSSSSSASSKPMAAPGGHECAPPISNARERTETSTRN